MVVVQLLHLFPCLLLSSWANGDCPVNKLNHSTHFAIALVYMYSKPSLQVEWLLMGSFKLYVRDYRAKYTMQRATVSTHNQTFLEHEFVDLVGIN